MGLVAIIARTQDNVGENSIQNGELGFIVDCGQLVTVDENIITNIMTEAGLSFGLQAKDKKLKLLSMTGLVWYKADLADSRWPALAYVSD